MPFDVATHDGVMTLTLDTPGSGINIFNHATAHQLVELLAPVTPATTRAIVFETAKPNSFINGVGLLLAHAAQNQADVERASAPPWAAYRAVRDAPVPTIAMVQGSCFGCGVEFALQCDFRLASDSWETQFYMTELNDYLFIPLFGSTWNLPEAVGLADAIDLLLWGDRWGAARACARGLVDEVVPPEDLAARRDRFVERILRGASPSRRRGRVTWGAGEDAAVQRARQRIAELPPAYRPVYSDALALLEAGARQARSYVDHQRQELQYSGLSALQPIARSAFSFFYLRQMASERAAGRLRDEVAPVRFNVHADDDDGLRAWAGDLGVRKLPGVSFGADAADFHLVAAQSAAARAPRNGCGPRVAVQLGLARGPVAETQLYVPQARAGWRLIELATSRTDGAALDPAARRQLARALQRLGFEVAHTTPGDTFVSTRLLIAYLAPLLRFVAASGAVEVVNATLRTAGFQRRPHEQLAGLDRDLLAAWLAPELGCAPPVAAGLLAALQGEPRGDSAGDETIVDGLCLSLLDAVLATQSAGAVRDASIIDLIARELLDFPRHLCSLATWLKKARVRDALDRVDARALVPAAAAAAAQQFVASGREFYR